MKKSKYIGKYDYIGYYTKQRSMWFFSNNEILSGIKTQIEKIKKEQSNNSYCINISLNDNNEEDETIIENEPEFDCFEFYKEQLEINKNIDKDDPRISEGNIIDQKSKEFIKKEYKSINKILDIDYEYGSNEKLNKMTIDFLDENKNCIIFQPVFIHNNLVTKCDALIKKNNFIYIIETKGTSTARSIHYLDLLYQKNVIENDLYFKNKETKYEFIYKLCIVQYEKCKKDDISFCIVDTFTNTKSARNISDKIKLWLQANDKENETDDIKRELKHGGCFDKEFNINYTMINEVLNNNFESIKKTSTDNSDFYLEINNKFNYVIDELYKRKNELFNSNIDLPENFVPSKEDNGDFKRSNFWNELKELYTLLGYEIFNYSGSFVKQDKNMIDEITKNGPSQINENNIKSSEKNINRITNILVNKKDLINLQNSKKLLSKINSKKVYFDFETICPAIRVIDNSLPFSQIITQCSIIKSSSENISQWEAINLVYDPKKVNINCFKEVVDNLYEPTAKISYIVYNKSFEKSRLNELKSYINNKEYTKKIDHIVNNLFDLADLFDYRKDTISISKLNGFYSIKKVLALIKESAPEIFNITGCKDYKKLDISNGGVCQIETLKRFFDNLNDNDWNNLVPKLKEYCENDVRAMIAVELYAKKLIHEYQEYLKNKNEH